MTTELKPYIKVSLRYVRIEKVNPLPSPQHVHPLSVHHIISIMCKTPYSHGIFFSHTKQTKTRSTRAESGKYAQKKRK